jgi:Tol biopolymer transport system component
MGIGLGTAARRAAVIATTVGVLSGCAYVGRISDPGPGASPTGADGTVAASADGRYVVYAAYHDRTPHGESEEDVYLYDAATSTRELVSIGFDGTPGNDWSFSPSISADGRYVAFASDADNLVPDDQNSSTDVFVRDRVAKTTTRVSVATGGGEADDWSYDPSISDDGRYVAFTSDSDLLVPSLDSNGSSDVFVRDRTLGKTVLASTSGSMPNTDFGAWSPQIAGNGKFVAFVTDTAMLAADTNDDYDVYLRNLVSNTTAWISKPRVGFPDGGGGDEPSVSVDGKFVAFSSWATDLDTTAVADDTYDSDVFLRDITNARTTRVSVATNGKLLPGESSTPSISGDGRWIAFASTGNASGTDTNGPVPDVFVRDMILGRTALVSTSANLTQASGPVWAPRISRDGRYAYWRSDAVFHPDDENGLTDFYYRAVQVPKVTSITPATLTRGTSKTVTINGQGFLGGIQLWMPDGVTASGITWNGDASITATFTAAANAPVGPQTVYVSNQGTGPGVVTGGTGECKSCLTIN